MDKEMEGWRHERATEKYTDQQASDVRTFLFEKYFLMEGGGEGLKMT